MVRFPSVCGAVAFVSIALGAHADEIIEISPGETVLVERYVRAIPEPPPIIEEHMTLRPGSILPEAVPLRRFAFFVSVDRKIVVVDPRTRVVVRILDQKS